MTTPNMRIWHQSFTVLENLKQSIDKVIRPDTEVVMHGMHEDTFKEVYPGTDIRHSLIFRMHSNQWIAYGLTAEDQGFDAYAMGTIPDPALWDIRSALNIPVVSYGETAMLLACFFGRKFGIMVFIDTFPGLIADNVERYGLTARCAAVRHAGFKFADVASAFSNPGPMIERFQESARRLIAEGADVIIPGEAPLCSLLAANGINRVDDVPVLDGFGATIKMAEMMVDFKRATGVTPSSQGYFCATPPRKRLNELMHYYGMDTFTKRFEP